jgi:hypothetical protein
VENAGGRRREATEGRDGLRGHINQSYMNGMYTRMLEELINGGLVQGMKLRTKSLLW